MDAPTLAAFKNLSNTAKKTLLEVCVVYPETESIKKDIERATTLQTKIEYKNLNLDLDRIVTLINSNPRFVQLQSRDICIELLQSLATVGDLDQMLDNVDYIVFQRIKMPILCLENKNDSIKVGISAFIELTEVRMKIHRMIDWQAPTPTLHVIGIVSALVLAAYAALK